MIALILSIVIPLILVLGLGAIFTIMYLASKKAEAATKGTLLFRLDIENRKIKRYDIRSNKIVNRYIFNSKFNPDWIPLTELTDSFKGTVGEKEFRNGLLKALNEDTVEFSFTTSKVVKKEKIVFKVIISRVGDSDIHTFSISWDRPNKTEEFSIDTKKYTKLELADDAAKYKGFIGFALDSNIPHVEALFARDLVKIFRFKKVPLFFAKGLACIPFFDDDRKKVKRRMNRFIRIMVNRGYRLGINRLTFGSGKITSKEVNTPKRINVVLKSLDFLVNLSIRHGEDFVNNKSEVYTDEEYISYVEAAQIFRLALRSGDVKSVPIAVRKFGSKRKVIEYVVPTIDNVSNEVLTSILRNDYNRSSLINVHAKNISIENKLTKPSLFDVNVQWLVDNRNKVNVKKAVYVLNFPKTVEQSQIDAVLELKESGFIFAIRIDRFNEEVSTLIMKVKPQFIVVDKKLSSDSTTSSYIQLVSIKKLSDHEGSRLIFENPATDIDKKWAEKIGLNFYYEF